MTLRQIMNLFVLALFMGLPLTAQAAAPPVDSWVLVNKLNLRQGPGRAEAIIKKLPYGAKVRILAADPAGLAEGVAEGIKGQWLKVRAGVDEGFVFDQFICPVPAPSLRDRNFTNSLVKTGPPVERKTKGLITISQKYSHGVTVVDRRILMGDGGYFEEQTIRVAGISTFQGFLLARAIEATEGPKDHNLTRWAKVAERDGRTGINEDSAWQIIAVAGGNGFVTIMFPERAD